MPIYAMQCRECGSEHDIFRRVAERDRDLPTCCGTSMERRVSAPFVQADMAPYQAVFLDHKTGRAPVIEGRVQHREALRRNGLIEAPEIKPAGRETVRGDFNVRRELTEATRQVLAKQG